MAVPTGVTGMVVRRSRRGNVAQELLGERCWGGDGALEYRHLVSPLAAAALLGTPAAC